MKRFGLAVLALGAVFLGSAPRAQAQGAATIDPDAMAAMQRMGTYLRGLTAFQVEVATTDEDVLDDGQKLQYAGVVTILARLPDRLLAQVSNDRYERQYVYDGSRFTLFAQRAGYYATLSAPPTIAQLATDLEQNFGLSVPLVDLFRWGAPQWSTERIKGAMVVGPATVAGTTCEQYAFRQDDIDWQIWIQRGDHPLPRRLVITSRTDASRPQHMAVYEWNLAPSFNDAAFAFDPPRGTARVVLLGAGTPAAAAN